MEKHWFQQFIMVKQESKLQLLKGLLYSSLALGFTIIILGNDIELFKQNVRTVITLVSTTFFGITFLFVHKYLEKQIGAITNYKNDWAYPFISAAFLIWAVSADVTLLAKYSDLLFDKSFAKATSIFFIKATLSSLNSLTFLIAIKHLTFFSTDSDVKEVDSFFETFYVKQLSYKRIWRITLITVSSSFAIFVFHLLQGVYQLNSPFNWISLPDFCFSIWVILALFSALSFTLRQRGFPAFIPVVDTALVITLIYQVANLFVDDRSFVEYLRPVGFLYQVFLAVVFLAIGLTYVLKVGEARFFDSKVRTLLKDFSSNNGFHQSNVHSIEQALNALAKFLGFKMGDLLVKLQIESQEINDKRVLDSGHAAVKVLRDCYKDGKISSLLVLFTIIAAINDYKKKGEDDKEMKEKKEKSVNIILEKLALQQQFDEGFAPTFVRDDLVPFYVNPSKNINRNLEDIIQILELIFTLFSEIGFSMEENESLEKPTLHAMDVSTVQDGVQELRITLKNIKTESLKNRLHEVQTKTTLPWRHIVSKTLLRLYEKLNKPASAYTSLMDGARLTSSIVIFDYDVVDSETFCIIFKSHSAL